MRRVLSIILCLALIMSLFGIDTFADDTAEEDNTAKIYYIDAENGDDSNSGTSEDDAWQTLDNFEFTWMKPGGKILLKRGQTFEGKITASSHGTAEAPIELSAYGEGEKPIITIEGEEIILLFNGAEYWTVSDVEFRAHEGCPIYIQAADDETAHIHIKNCDFRDTHPEELDSIDTFYSAINIRSYGEEARVHDVLIEGINVKDCAIGLHSTGYDPERFGEYATPKKDYNYNIKIKDSIFEDCQAGAVIFGSMYKSSVENCLIKDCATNNNFPCAPIWFRHSDRCVFSHCEVSGSKNEQDGMTIDFDGWTTNCTYEYIYSHDNNRFIKNCLYDNHTRNRGNTVKRCLSVNDNINRNLCNTPLIAKKNIWGLALVMEDFTFENNTLVNISPVHFDMLKNAKIRNNIIIGQKSTKSDTFFTNLTALFNTGEFSNNCFWDYFTPLTAKDSIKEDPALDENYVTTALSRNMGALNGKNYVGCRLDNTN